MVDRYSDVYISRKLVTLFDSADDRLTGKASRSRYDILFFWFAQGRRLKLKPV